MPSCSDARVSSTVNGAEEVAVTAEPHTGQPAVVGTDGATPPKHFCPKTGHFSMGRGAPCQPPCWSRLTSQRRGKVVIQVTVPGLLAAPLACLCTGGGVGLVDSAREENKARAVVEISVLVRNGGYTKACTHLIPPRPKSKIVHN